MAKEIIVSNQKEWDALIDNQKQSGDVIIRVGFIEICGNSSVTAYGNSSVTAYGNSSVTAYGNSSVTAYGNSSVTACGNSSVTAYDNSSVRAYGNSSVTAYDCNAIYRCSTESKIKIISKWAKILEIPKYKWTTKEWLQRHGIAIKLNNVILFKRVSSEYKTQEGTLNETFWEMGKTLTHPRWSPKDNECGEGKYHAVAAPFFADEFRNTKGDRYIAIKIDIKDLYVWPNPSYPHKIAFRKGKVLYDCDINGNKIEKKA